MKTIVGLLLTIAVFAGCASTSEPTEQVPPTPTKTVAATAVVTAPPLPTLAPTLAPTPTLTSEPTPTSSAVPLTATSVSGSGNRVVDLPINGGGLCVFTATIANNVRDGFEELFHVDIVFPEQKYWLFEFVSEGTYQTTATIQSNSVILEIDAVGSWTVTSDCRG